MKHFSTLFIFFLYFSLGGFAQSSRTIQGRITDDKGEGLPGVSVYLKHDNTIGTLTNIHGDYTLQNVPIGSIVIFSAVGFDKQEIEVTATNFSEFDNVKPQKGQNKDPLMKPEKIYRHAIPENPDNKTLSPYFFVKSHNPKEDQMPLKHTSADVNIAGVMADVTVKQVYVNEGKNTLEAIYIFPSSTHAAIYAMTMQIGDRTLEAKIKEKQKARKEYEEAKESGKTATLLEQERPNVFKMNVANILPGDKITVTLKYTELLIPNAGIYEFVYPTVVGPRYAEPPTEDDPSSMKDDWVGNPYLQEKSKPNFTFDIKTKINAGLPIQEIKSNSHQVKVNFKDKNSGIVKLNETEFAGDRDYILQYRLSGGKIESSLLLQEREDENFFLLMMQPPKQPTLAQIPPREYVFIIDISGSMSGFPIDVAKKLLKTLISELRPNDKFNVIFFESGAQLLAKKSLPANQKNINEAIKVIDNRRGGGGTRLLQALQKAFKFQGTQDFSRTFVVITDGYVTVEKEAFELVRKNLGNANLFPFGIGSSPNRHLIEGLANVGMSVPFIVTNETEAEEKGKKMINFIKNPVLTNIKIDWGDFEVYEVEPSSVPDVFAERPIIVYGKYKNEAKGKIKVRGLSGENLYQKELLVDSASTENNEALRYLWARSKIKRLDDYKSLPQYAQEQQIHIQEITNLGLKYNLLTAYTSFIAVDKIRRNTSGEYKTQKQPLPLPKGVTNLSLSNSSLSEVVVTGYRDQTAIKTTSSVIAVTSNTIEQTPLASFDQILQGQAPGLLVQAGSGRPGASANVTIRGINSINGSNQPLYVVDGVQVSEADFKNMNANDIETVNILKDAGATAIYGSRGANGVIVVASKRGKAGRPQVNYRFQTGWNQKTQDKVEMMNTAEKIDLEQKLFAQGVSVGEVGKVLSNTSLSDSEKAQAIQNLQQNDINWQEEFFRNGRFQQHELNVSKGKENLRFYTSFNYRREEGILEGSDLERVTFRLNLDKGNSNSKFRTGFSSNVGFGESSLLSTEQGNNLNNPVLNMYLQNPYVSDKESVLQNIQQAIGSENSFKTIAHIWAEYDIVEGLTLRNNLGIDYNTNAGNRWFTQNPNNFFTEEGDMLPTEYQSWAWQWRGSLNYTKLFGNDHEFASSLALQINEQNISGKNYLGLGLFPIANNLALNSLSLANTDYIQMLGNFDTHNRLVSSFANAQYTFKSKYTLQVNVSLDNSSRFASQHRQELFWSVGSNWILSEENFMDNIDFINLLKLRTSYGKQGNNFAPGNYNYQDLSDESGNLIQQGNADYDWETTHTLNVGLDFGIFRNRIAGSLEFYDKRTQNMYLNTTLALSNIIFPQNAGKVLNRGWELQINAEVLNMEDFTWNLASNLSRNYNEVLSLPKGENIILGNQVLEEGQALGSHYLPNFAGVDSETGDALYITSDGSTSSDFADAQYVAQDSWMPTLYGGFTNSFYYKGFSLSVHFTFARGHKLLNYNRFFAENPAFADYNQSPAMADIWTEKGQITDIPRADVTRHLTNRYLEDGSFMRLRNLTLAYYFPTGLLDKIKLRSLRLYLSGQNLMTFTKFGGFDPENYGNLMFSNYPVPRTYSLGVDIGF